MSAADLLDAHRVPFQLMGGKPETVVGRVAKGPDDRYQRPGPMTTERPSVMLAKGGKVPPAAPRARMAQAMAKKAESKGEQRTEMRKDMRQDKKMTAKMIGKHESHLHKGEPKTKFAKGGKVACLAAGGAAKIRKGMAKPVPKSPRGGNPQY